MIWNSQSLLSLRFRHPNLVTLIGWGKHYELPSLSQHISASYLTFQPSQLRHRYLVYELMTGGDIYDRLLKSRKRQNPVAFHWPGGPKESKTFEYPLRSMNLNEHMNMNPWFWAMWQNVTRFSTSNSLFFTPWGMKDWVPCRMQHLAFPICTIPTRRRFIGWKPQSRKVRWCFFMVETSGWLDDICIPGY